MKYKIIIEGGFTGISRKYEGDMAVSELKAKSLFSALHTDDKTRSNIADGQTYDISLDDNHKKYQAVFNEKNVPDEIRELIAQVKQKNR